MKIAFISTMSGCPWGGSEILWASTARLALDEGHSVVVVTPRWHPTPNPIVALQDHGALTFHRAVDRERRVKRIFEQLIHPLPRLRRWRPDVVCYSEGGAFEVAACLDLIRFQKRCESRYVVVCQFNDDTNIPAERIRSRAIPFYQQAYRTAFVAERNRETTLRQIAADLPNSCVLRNPVNLSSMDAVPWPTSPFVQFASVARLETRCKGQDILFGVLRNELWRERQWRLGLYGDGPDRAYLQSLVKYYSLEDRVELCGHVGDVRSIWARNHILVLPSRSEGTPLALVEAMICGRPAIVTDVGGNREWIDEPGTGFVAEAPTALCMAAALERAWQAQVDWQEMGTQARKRALTLVDPAPAKTLLNLLLAAGQRQAIEH